MRCKKKQYGRYFYTTTKDFHLYQQAKGHCHPVPRGAKWRAKVSINRLTAKKTDAAAGQDGAAPSPPLSGGGA